jgi:RNA polymerase sigma-70 factor (ECF subfamily)
MMNITHDVVERVYREESGRILAALIRGVGDFDLAEDALQDAFVKALERWPVDGLPDHPGAWVTRVARNRLIDRLRTIKAARVVSLEEEALDGYAAALALDDYRTTTAIDTDMLEKELDSSVEDDRLRLIFTCCHPALKLEAQVAMTLRTLGGLTTEEIARAFLLPAPTVAQRIVRAKRKIREANIPYRVPPDHLLPQRVPAVLAVVYLVCNEGYTASGTGEASPGAGLIRAGLCVEAIRLARVLAALMPDEPEALGLCALLLLHDSRRAARTSADGELVLLEDQDRSLWNSEQIREGHQTLERALRLGRPGPYQLQAAIAAVHAEAPAPDDTDWPQIAALYERLAALDPSPVIALNAAVAEAFAYGLEHGLARMEALGQTGTLDGYLYYHAARADLLRRLNRAAPARRAYERALELAGNVAERRYLQRRLKEVTA